MIWGIGWVPSALSIAGAEVTTRPKAEPGAGEGELGATKLGIGPDVGMIRER